MNSNNEIAVGVIGVGHLGRHHARIWSELPGCHLVGIVDKRLKQREKISADLGVPSFENHQALLKKVQAVSIAVPTINHFQVAKDFLAQGVHVLVEKPIAKDLEEADRMLQIAEENGVILQVGHSERFNSVVQILSKLVKEARFVEAHRLSPFPERGTDVDVILDLMIHDLDLIQYLDGSEIENIDAIGVAVLSKEIDIANARLHFKSGCVANLTASRVSLQQVRKLRIFQPNSYITADLANQKLAIFRRVLENNSEENNHPHIVTETPVIEPREPLREELKSFLTAIKEDKRPVVTGYEGRKALEAALKITEAIKKRMAKEN